MNASYTADVLASVPTYTEATFTLASGREVRGIARDLPRPGRRWTVDGWEWFIDADLISRMEIIRVDLSPIRFDVLSA